MPVIASRKRCKLGRTVESVAGRLRLGGAGEILQMLGLGLVEPQRAGQSVEDLRGDTGQLAALHAGVVVDAHPGQQRDLLAAQAGYAAVAAGDHAGLLRGDPRATGAEELADLVLVVHVDHGRPGVGNEGGTGVTRNNRHCRAAAIAGGLAV